MPALYVSGSGGHYTKGTVNITNSTICTFKRISVSSQQMHEWDKNWPDEIKPGSSTPVKVIFITRKSIPFHLDRGEVAYEVFDNAGLSLATFNISANADSSEVSCCCLWKFKGEIRLDWQTLPKVFGVQVEPSQNKPIPFKLGQTIDLKISGNVLRGGARDFESETKITEFKKWDEMDDECQVGDIIAVDRGAFRHLGIVQALDETGVKISHLSGTAGQLLQEHGLGGGVREVWSALTGSHGDIAGVSTVTLEEFATGDLCRVENLHDDEWKKYENAVILERIAQATGTRDYSLTEFNCEHYANLIRYGMPYSAQFEAMKRKFDMGYHRKQMEEDIQHGFNNFQNNVKQFGIDMKSRTTELRGDFSQRFHFDKRADDVRISGGGVGDSPEEEPIPTMSSADFV